MVFFLSFLNQIIIRNYAIPSHVFLQAILKELATKNGFVSHAKNKSKRINFLAMSLITQPVNTS